MFVTSSRNVDPYGRGSRFASAQLARNVERARRIAYVRGQRDRRRAAIARRDSRRLGRLPGNVWSRVASYL